MFFATAYKAALPKLKQFVYQEKTSFKADFKLGRRLAWIAAALVFVGAMFELIGTTAFHG